MGSVVDSVPDSVPDSEPDSEAASEAEVAVDPADSGIAVALRDAVRVLKTEVRVAVPVLAVL